MRYIGLLFTLLWLLIACGRGDMTIDTSTLESMAIILPDEPGSISSFSAHELNKHFELIYGKTLPVRIQSQAGNDDFLGRFYIGTRPPGFDRDLEDEEGVYSVQNQDLYIFGDDLIRIPAGEQGQSDFGDPVLDEVLQMDFNRTGTLFALYNFLERELGVQWLKPGNNGIFYTPDLAIVLSDKEVSWKPRFFQRNIRAGYFRPGKSQFAPGEFALTKEQSLQKAADEKIWLRRMRFGRSRYYQFGHAFTTYWEKYQDSHPDIFALNAEGKREPLGRIERVKMCPSNPDLVNVVVDEWLINKGEAPYRHGYSISGCENDTDGFGNAEWCHCENCRALDAHLPSEELEDHLTDRYTWFWNNLVTEARKHQDDIMVSCYAYQETLLPPRNLDLKPGIVVEFIPRMAGDFEKTQSLYDGWREKGMDMMMFRPNDLTWHFGITLGQEERVFRHFQLAVRNGALGTDFDSMYGYWEGISDLTYYILARAHLDPEASFEELEAKFLNEFGPASDDIKAYYAHWRNIFNTKMIPADLELSDGVEPVYFEWYRMGKLTQRIDDFISIEDYDVTDTYLSEAVRKDISPLSRDYIQRMQLANTHSRLTYLCLLAGIEGDEEKIRNKALELVRFRIENKNKIDINWNMLFWSQYYHLYDQIGTKHLDFLADDINLRDF